MRLRLLPIVALFALPAAPAAFAADCTCETLDALQNELKIALTLRDRHRDKARQLRDTYGDPPKDENISASRRDYHAFEDVPENGPVPPGHVSEGLPRPTPGAPQAVKYVPRGTKLREMGQRNVPGGIESPVKVTPIGQEIPDVEARQRIEKAFRDRKQDLCDHEDEAGFKRAMASGSVCGAVTRALEVHEDTHRQTCRRMGFYGFADRYPAAMADDEVKAYQAQIDVLAADIRRILKQKKTKLVSGAPGGTPESLVDVKVRCALAFTAVGRIDDLTFNDKVCDAAEAFTVKTSPNANFRFTPTGEKAGTYAYRGNIVGATFYGSGGYRIDMTNGKGTLVMDGAGRWWVTHPKATASKGGPETLRLTELPEGCS